MSSRISLFVLISLVISCNVRCDSVSALNPIGMPVTVACSDVLSVDWCRCNYIATGLSGCEGNGEVAIYQFDQKTEILSSIGTKLFGSAANSVKWCPSCGFLAAGGRDPFGNGIIQGYSFDGTHILEAGSLSNLGTAVNSIDWCLSCSILAAGASDGGSGKVQVYHFDPNSGFSIVGSAATFDAQINSLKWCDDCQHLTIVDAAGNLYVYTFNAQTGLTQLTSIASTAVYRSIDVCSECSYFAVGGIRDLQGIIDIYKFDTQPVPSLHYVTTATISTDQATVASVQWCQDCDNIAIAGSTLNTNEGIVQLYHFNTSTQILSFVQTYTFSGLANAVAWCDNCCYLAMGGNNVALGLIQLFSGNICPIGPASPTNLSAQKTLHRFPTQIDIINTICWDAVTGAVAYNVYADINLTLLLATITNAPLCYSQHQICNGKSVTYFVTAVDANGTQSESAVVTI